MKTLQEIVVVNFSKFPTKQLTEIVKSCIPPGHKKGFTINFIQSGLKDDWDGETDIETRIIDILIPAKNTFPQVLDINHDLPGSYLRQIYLNDINEFLIWLLGHEIFHILYSDNPDLIVLNKKIKKFIECDEEMLADVYGLALLAKFRRNKF